MEAHKREASLRVSGSLEKEGQLFWLYGANDVSIVFNSDALASNGPDQSDESLFE